MVAQVYRKSLPTADEVPAALPTISPSDYESHDEFQNMYRIGI